MPIKLIIKKDSASFLDPNDSFAEKKQELEYRIDPLTGDMGLVKDLRFTAPPKPDLTGIIAKSRSVCPFCPDQAEKKTPKFIPAFLRQGRIKVGEATLFPNLNPYNPYSAVAVVCRQHHVGLTEFTTPMLADAFLAGREYLKTVSAYDSKAVYCGIMWNYFPPANSSQIHPHMQPFAARFAMRYHQKLLVSSKRYLQNRHVNYWEELIQQETKQQKRYIGKIGRTVWLASFVPRSYQMDVRVVFRKKNTVMSLSDKDLRDFSEGLTRLFRYMDDQNYYSFNLFLYSGLTGDDSFWTQARIIQRGPLPFVIEISDAGNAALLGDTYLAIRSPEYVAEGLRRYFS